MNARINALLAAGSLALLLAAAPLTAQIELGVAGGASMYEGDLAPSSVLDKLTSARRSVGVYARGPISERVALRGFVQSSRIHGDDALRPGTVARNLSFRSDIFEIGLAAEVYVLGYDHAVAPYVSVGASVYRFNPEAEFNGRLVELQPLGTEGQGIPGFGEKYALTRFAIPVGVGARYPLGESFVLGVDVSSRLTWFDHLDDVSGNYVNYETLLRGEGVDGSRGNGSLAAALADRTGEYLGTDPRDVPTGTLRGDPTNNDWFYTATVTIGYRIGSGLFGVGGGRSAGSNRYNRCYEW